MSPEVRSLSDGNRDAFLIELCALAEEAAEAAARSLADGTFDDAVAYPPDHDFTEGELAALRAVATLPHVESALRKVIADACSDLLFRVLCIIDGVGDPRIEGWTGVSLLDMEDTDERGEFLHDEFPAKYSDWQELKANAGEHPSEDEGGQARD